VQLTYNEVRFAADGVEIHMRVESAVEFQASAPHRFQRSVETSLQGGLETRLAIENGAEKLVAVTASAGSEHRQERPAVDYRLADAVTPYLWLRSGRESGESLLVRSLDTDELALEVHTYSVTAVHDTVRGGVPYRWFEVDLSTPDGETGSFVIDAAGDLVKATLLGIIELRREPEEVAKRRDRPVDLFAAGRLSVDAPLGPAVRVTELVVDVRVDETLRFRDGPRQSVTRKDGADTYRLRVGAGHGKSEKLTEEDRERYLAATVGFPADHPRVAELVERAVGDAEAPRERLHRLVRFVSGFVVDDAHVEPPTVAAIIEMKKGDCSAHAALLTTLARAAGLPARSVIGFAYEGDDLRSFGPHAWNEVAIDGVWVPVDATWNQVELDAAHLRLGHDDEPEATRIFPKERLTLHVVSVKHRR
jgi:hypothetical protein